MACRSPIIVENVAAFEKIPVPCGKCVECKIRRVDEWVFRLMQEDRNSSQSHFVTLTYDTLSVPITDHGFMSLLKSDFQNFMKRLRKNTGYEKIRYYAVGEYGELNSRPHMHAIIFNCDTAASYQDAWSLTKTAWLERYNKENQSFEDYRDPYPDLEKDDKIWFGHVDVQPVSRRGIAYVCKYLDKRKGIPSFPRDDRAKEFSLMSRGLGESYLTPETIAFHRANPDQLYVTHPGGYKVPMPKYYREKIWNEEERREQLDIIYDAIETQVSEEKEWCAKNGKDWHHIKAEERRVRKYAYDKKNSKNRKL